MVSTTAEGRAPLALADRSSAEVVGMDGTTDEHGLVPADPAVQVGGPLGAYIPASQFDMPFDYEAFASAGAMVGHGGIVVFDDTVDMAKMARYAMEFCAIESCGKCTPCRIGSTRGVEVIDRITAGIDRDRNLVLLEELCETMTDGSLCAMGGLTPLPVRSALTHFPEDFHRAPEATQR